MSESANLGDVGTYVTPKNPPLPIATHSRLRLRKSRQLRKGIPAFLLKILLAKINYE